MAQSLARLVQLLQDGMQQGELKALKPFFELVGSMAEGTRISLANELDLTIKFRTWMDNAPFKVEGHPYTLKKARGLSLPIMEQFFDGKEFKYHTFMHFLLKNVDKVISDIFDKSDKSKSDDLIV